MVIFEEFSIDFIDRLPDSFFNKECNESFCGKVLCTVFHKTNYRKGDPKKSEPDLFIDDVPFEVTIVSDKNKHNNLVQRMLNRWNSGFSCDDINREILKMIDDRIRDKANKHYCTPCPYLCLIVPLPMISWLKRVYAQILSTVFSDDEAKQLQEYKTQYIDTCVFSSIFVLFPDLNQCWWILDLKTRNMVPYQGDINDASYPYYQTIERT